MRGGYWRLLALALFVAGLLLHQLPLLLVALLLALVRLVTRLWERFCLARVEYRRRLSASRVFFGEEIQREVEVANRKPLPLPWIEIEEEVPSEVTFLKGSTSPSYKMGRMVLTNLVSLGWYHRVKRRYPIRCLRRGCFTFGPTRIRSGDLFGFVKREMEINEVDYLMVYPKIVPLEKLGIPSRQPLGDIRTRHLFEDPVLTLGVRDYHFGDSLKRIHWKTTARTGQLKTKLFEPTTTVDLGIFLDVRTMRPPAWGTITELMELGIITAASLASHALGAGYRVGLYINQRQRFSDQAVRMAPSQHPDQLLHILEALAQINTSIETMPMARLVLGEGRNLPWGSTMVVITATPTDALYSSLVRMKRAGRSVALIVVGGQPPGGRDGLPVYHIPGEVVWNALEMLPLKGE